MRSKSILKNKKFLSKCNRFFRQNKDKLLDIILFGSAVRGKEEYNDVDVLLLFKDKINLDLSYEFKNLFLELPVSVTSKTYESLFKSSFLAREGLLSDGYSVVHKSNFCKLYGYKTYYLFKYSLGGFSNTQRVKFYYALYGRRGNKGVLYDVKGIKFSQTIVLVPLHKSDVFKQFLMRNNISFEDIPILIPERIEL